MSTIKVVGDGDGQVARLADTAAETLGLRGECEVELIYCTAEEIHELNLRTRGVDSVTDVLSFPALELKAGEYEPFTAENFPFGIDPDSGNILLGSIVICERMAALQAIEYGHSIEREKGYLFLHGLLHLFGYDHMTDEDKTLMRETEEKILAEVGLVR